LLPADDAGKGCLVGREVQWSVKFVWGGKKIRGGHIDDVINFN